MTNIPNSVDDKRLKALLIEAREGSTQAQIDFLNAYRNRVETIYSLIETDKDWIEKQADAGNINAICCLYFAMIAKVELHTETYFDEDTGEEISNEQLRYIEDETTFSSTEQERLKVFDKILSQNSLNDDDFQLMLFSGITQYSHTFRKELYEKHKNPKIADELGHDYLFGCEGQGCFIDIKKAKHYFNLAGNKKMADICDDFYDDFKVIFEYPTYIINGDEDQIANIITIINKLTENFDTSDTFDNKSGLNVSVKRFIQVLVGSDAYIGNILSVSRTDNNTLKINAEVDSDSLYPLKFALEYAFEGVNVEIDVEAPSTKINRLN